ncbi:hypothetical protein [Microbacterium sp.]|uniref:hypothetical protein n=1 Tax=Microbacterium sp. TaxID=51671 RepID=UPI0039E2E922
MISTRVAVARERAFWDQLDFTNRSTLKLKAAVGETKYPIRLVDHVSALEDEGTLMAATLVLSYALAESAVVDRLCLDSRSVAGIEDWGGRLLRTTGGNWSSVTGGLAGAVEVGVVRNVIVHGQSTIDEKNYTRLEKAGSQAFALGDVVELTYESVVAYRARLKSLLAVGGLSADGSPAPGGK